MSDEDEVFANVEDVKATANCFMWILFPFVWIWPLVNWVIPWDWQASMWGSLRAEHLGSGFSREAFFYMYVAPVYKGISGVSALALIGIVIIFILKHVYLWGTKEKDRIAERREARRQEYKRLQKEFGKCEDEPPSPN